MVDARDIARFRAVANCGNHDDLAHKSALELADRCDDCARGLIAGLRAIAFHDVAREYGGDEDAPDWQSAEGIAGIIEDLSGQARANAFDTYGKLFEAVEMTLEETAKEGGSWAALKDGKVELLDGADRILCRVRKRWKERVTVLPPERPPRPDTAE